MRTKYIAERIRAVRKGLGLTLREFAKPLGVSQGYLSDIENEKKTPSETLEKLLLVHYAINSTWWESGEGEMFAKKKDTVAEADHLDADLSRLVIAEVQNQYGSHPIELTPQEITREIMIRSLPEEARQHIDYLIHATWAAEQAKRSE